MLSSIEEQAVQAGLVDIDGTFVIQLGVFLVFFVLFSTLVVKPLIRTYRLRFDRMQGAREAAEEFTARAAAASSTYEAKIDEARKNAMCRVAPHPEVPEDYLSGMIVTLQNMNDWGREFIWWLRRSRLCFSHHAPLWSFVLTSIKMNRMLMPAVDKMIRLKTEASSSS